MSNLFTELKRRNVFKVGVAYLVVGWLTVQVVSSISPMLELPAVFGKMILVALLIGFPIALLFAWAFELTPEGIKKSSDVDVDSSVTHQTSQKINYVIIGALVLLVGGMGYERMTMGSAPDSDADEATSENVSIAVLPFADMSPDKDQEYFTDGISEELLNVLAKVPQLHVAARTSSFAFKGRNEDIREIGNLLGVDHILEGSIRKSGTKLRITAQLINVDNNFHMWSETYDRELTDVFAIQDEISAAILDAMKVHLLGEESEISVSTTTNTLAYEQYLIARNLIIKRTRLDIEAAVDYLKNSILQDPNYAPSQAWLGLAYILLENSNGTYGELTRSEVETLAKPPIDRALELEPDNAEAHAILGLFLNHREGNDDETLKEYDEAIRLNPSLSMAYNWRSQELNDLARMDESFSDQEMAYSLDPLSILSGANMVNSYMQVGRSSEAKAVLDKLERVHPRASRLPEMRAYVAFSEGDFEAAIKQVYKALKFEPSDLRVQGTISDLYQNIGLYGRALAFADDEDKQDLYEYQGNYGEAYKLAEKRLLDNPDTEWALSNAATRAIWAGYSDRALELSGQAEAFMKTKPSADCEGSMMLMWKALGKPERAELYRPACETLYQKFHASLKPNILIDERMIYFAAVLEHSDDMFEMLETNAERGMFVNIVRTKFNPFYQKYKDDALMTDYMERADKAIAEQRALVLLLEKRGEIPNPIAK